MHGLGLSHQYDPELPPLCSTFRDVGLLRMGSWISAFTRLGVRHAIMVGKVDKARIMHDPWRLLRYVPDLRTARAWYRSKHTSQDKRSHAVLTMVAEELDRSGVQLLDSTIPIPDQLATAGVMTKRQPTPAQRSDIEFVWPLLTEVLRLDIGQAIAVRDQDVIAVEAVEGTDLMISRTGQMCKATGWTLVKGARAGHDRRADVPTVGVNTIKNLYDHGGRCLALAAGDVIMVDRPQLLELADKLGVAVVGVTPGQAMGRV